MFKITHENNFQSQENSCLTSRNYKPWASGTFPQAIATKSYLSSALKMNFFSSTYTIPAFQLFNLPKVLLHKPKHYTEKNFRNSSRVQKLIKC